MLLQKGAEEDAESSVGWLSSGLSDAAWPPQRAESGASVTLSHCHPLYDVSHSSLISSIRCRPRNELLHVDRQAGDSRAMLTESGSLFWEGEVRLQLEGSAFTNREQSDIASGR